MNTKLLFVFGLLWLIAAQSTTSGQVASHLMVTTGEPQVLWSQSPNRVLLGVANERYDSLTVETTHATFRRLAPDRFEVTPPDLEPVVIKVWLHRGNTRKEAGELTFKVAALAMPVALFGNHPSGDTITLAELKEGVLQAVSNESSTSGVHFHVTGFTLEFIGRDSSRYRFEVIGDRISSLLTEPLLSKIVQPSVLTFTRIVVVSSTGSKQAIEPVWYRLK